MQEMWVRPLGWEDPLEKEIATHSSILAWRIPWTEEPDRLQLMGSQRVRHSRVTGNHILVCSVAQSCPTVLRPQGLALQACLSMEFPREEYWHGLPFSPLRASS